MPKIAMHRDDLRDGGRGRYILELILGQRAVRLLAPVLFKFL
jgi:hypothetical protein